MEAKKRKRTGMFQEGVLRLRSPLRGLSGLACRRIGDKMLKVFNMSIMNILVWAYKTRKVLKVFNMLIHFFEATGHGI